MQPDREALSGRWLQTALEDLRVARVLSAESPSVAAFHCQQAAEKALKAACVLLIEDAPRTHLVEALLDELHANDVDIPAEVRRAAKVLERLYAPTRYPDALGGASPTSVFTVEDADEAIRHADVVIRLVRHIGVREP